MTTSRSRKAGLHLRSVVFGFVLGLALVATRGWAKGEFYREVPGWWVAPALCVHAGEGSWRDPGAPYYGGMQMDWNFMRRYGGWILAHSGTADHWAPRTQLLVAYRGWRRQGWAAWPNTSRVCGLL